MVVVAQLVRAPVCGTGGREFNSPQSPQQRDVVQLGRTLALGVRGRWFKSSHLDRCQGVASLIEVKIHNGQGLGVTSGKLTAIISYGGGNDRTVGSEWLTSIFTSNY